MSRYIILIDDDCAERASVITEDKFDPFSPNIVFESAGVADMWIQRNVKNGRRALIVEVEE